MIHKIGKITLSLIGMPENGLKRFFEFLEEVLNPEVETRRTVPPCTSRTLGNRNTTPIEFFFQGGLGGISSSGRPLSNDISPDPMCPLAPEEVEAQDRADKHTDKQAFTRFKHNGQHS